MTKLKKRPELVIVVDGDMLTLIDEVEILKREAGCNCDWQGQTFQDIGQKTKVLSPTLIAIQV